jgi:hypothetical protein
MDYNKLLKIAAKFEKISQNFEVGRLAADDVLKTLTPIVNKKNQALGGTVFELDIKPVSGPKGLTIDVQLKRGVDYNHQNHDAVFNDYVLELNHWVQGIAPQILAKHNGVNGGIEVTHGG